MACGLWSVAHGVVAPQVGRCLLPRQSRIGAGAAGCRLLHDHCTGVAGTGRSLRVPVWRPVRLATPIPAFSTTKTRSPHPELAVGIPTPCAGTGSLSPPAIP